MTSFYGHVKRHRDTQGGRSRDHGGRDAATSRGTPAAARNPTRVEREAWN